MIPLSYLKWCKDHPGVYSQRNNSSFGNRDFDSERAFTVGMLHLEIIKYLLNNAFDFYRYWWACK